MHIYLLKKDGMEKESQNKYLPEIYPRIEKRLKILLLFKESYFFILSHISSNSIFEKVRVEIDEIRNIKVDEEQNTNLKGLYTAGNITYGLYRVVFATVEYPRAGINTAKNLRQLQIILRYHLDITSYYVISRSYCCYNGRLQIF